MACTAAGSPASAVSESAVAPIIHAIPVTRPQRRITSGANNTVTTCTSCDAEKMLPISGTEKFRCAR